MTVQGVESPNVELNVGRHLTPAEVAAVTAANAATDPAKAFRHALEAQRAYTIRHLRDNLLNATVVNDTVIRQTLDAAWQLFVPTFKKATAPMIAEAYIRAFRDVQSDNIPIRLIYDLADQHAQRVGEYFNDTSAEALAKGFNTFVNRQVPQRAVVERVIDAYGMTPRQMSGFTSIAALPPQKIESGVARNLKRKLKAYVGASISQRLNVFVGQEAHNLQEQAQQVAWLWLVENGHLSPETQKIWLTAKDEKVCAICGPMHGVKIGVNDQFYLNNDTKVYVPGAHVNCRCTVRLWQEPFGKAFDSRKHPRESRGRFRAVPDVAELDPALKSVEQAAVRLKEEERADIISRIEEVEEKTDGPVLTSFKSAGQINLGGTPRLAGKLGPRLSTVKITPEAEQAAQQAEAAAVVPKLASFKAADNEGMPQLKTALKTSAKPVTITGLSIPESQIRLVTQVKLTEAIRQPWTQREQDLDYVDTNAVYFRNNYGEKIQGYTIFEDEEMYSSQFEPGQIIPLHEGNATFRPHDPKSPAGATGMTADVEAKYRFNVEKLTNDIFNFGETEFITDKETGFDEEYVKVEWPNEYKPFLGEAGGRIHTYLSRDQVRKLVQAAAHPETDWAKGATIRAAWDTENGSPYIESNMPILDLAKSPSLKVDYRNALRVTVFIADEAGPNTRHPDERELAWKTTGPYEVIEAHDEIQADSDRDRGVGFIPVDMVKVRAADVTEERIHLPGSTTYHKPD